MSVSVHVAVAVIRRESDGEMQILLSKRAETSHQGGLWEFPGGKVEPGEHVRDALIREIHEELGIELPDTKGNLQPLIQIHHDYGDKHVVLDTWIAHEFLGQPVGMEGQPVKWVDASELSNYSFPAANVPIIAAACLPRRLAISPEFDDFDKLVRYLENAFAQGFELVQVRQHHISNDIYQRWVVGLKERFGLQKVNSCMVFSRSVEVLQALNVDRWHLSSCQLMADTAVEIQAPQWLSASCHNAQELLRAQNIACDYVLLSPVRPTLSHPEKPVMGFDGFSALVESCKLPVYALGGLSECDMTNALQAGAQGVAAIRGWEIIS